MGSTDFAVFKEKYDIDEEILKKYLQKYKRELKLVRNFQLDTRTEPK